MLPVEKALKVVYSMIKIKKKTIMGLKEDDYAGMNKGLAERFIKALENDLNNLEKIKKELLDQLPGPPPRLKKR